MHKQLTIAEEQSKRQKCEVGVWGRPEMGELASSWEIRECSVEGVILRTNKIVIQGLGECAGVRALGRW